MADNQEKTNSSEGEEIHGDVVVISGISTLTSGCRNLDEFAEKLYNKESFVKSDNFRWKSLKHPELNTHLGKVPDIGQFDSQYFKIHYWLASVLDPAMKGLMEQSFQAIIDAGVCPSELSGKRVGVFISSALCETETLAFTKTYGTYAILGCNNGMLSNRISYYLNLKGPSVTMDGSCSGSILALQMARQAINTGLCDSAIVGAAKLVLLPTTSIMYQRTMPLSPDGKTRSYDESANGHSMSEAIIVMYLQKYKDAKRMYTTVCHAKTEFAATNNKRFSERRQGPYRDLTEITGFLRKFYEEAGVDPSQVDYVEGFGAAMPEVDKTELEAIEEIFCNNRSKPLLVGSVMSNVGYTETASGLCSIAKLILAYQRGRIAANLDCNNPRRDVDALREGRMRIVTENQNFNRLYAAINSFSLSGVNGHVLLKGYYKPKDLSRYHCNFPYLVLASGRQDSAVRKILDDVKSHMIDPEEIALLHNIFRSRISNHVARGFGIYCTKKEETVALEEGIQSYDETKRPLWFVYSGMGSQWAGMGVSLMQIPIFAAAIERCQKVLLTKGIDLINIITTSDESVFDNILNSFVGIAAIQIGLTDILKAIGLVPDNIIGHSVGELGCAYADECFTAEEMILMAYYRGLVSIETSFIQGSMAAVGIGYRQISKFCPPEIEVACRNSPNSCTISGPSKVVEEFVATLTSRGIFAKEVRCSNIPYHSRYIATAGPTLLKSTSQVIATPKLRSSKWISTSVPKEEWSKPEAVYCSAEYFTNNLLNPVLFEDMLHLVPSNAVMVEIAPHGLLQAILKRSLSSTCQNFSLTRRESPNNAQLLLQVIGRLYMEGYQVDISALYSKIEFPVSMETRSLSQIIEWVHNQKGRMCRYICPERNYTATYEQIVCLHDDEYSYLKGHRAQGSKSYPFAAALISAWDTLAMTINKKRRDVSVEFEDMTFYNQPQLYKDRVLRVTVSLQRGCGRFEVTYGNDSQSIIVAGVIKAVKTTVKYDNEAIPPMELTRNDIYKILQERGYEYRDEFMTIHKANISITHVKLIWNNNWVTLLDGMLQFDALRYSTDTVAQINHIKRININIKTHLTELLSRDKQSEILNARFDKLQNSVCCGGIVIENIIRKTEPALMRYEISMKKLKPMPFMKQENYKILWDDEYYEPVVNKTITTGHIALKSTCFGDVDSLEWVEVPDTPEEGIVVDVHYVGLNINDVKRAIAEIEDNKDGYGIDFSGYTERGTRVMGLTKSSSATNKICVNPNLLWPVPEHWSLEDAATVPLAYAHAFYCVVIKSQLKTKMTIFIHGGAGGLGQAIISIALAHDCEVFTTVGDIRKKHFLMKLFPNLKEDHIGNSRDISFGDMIMSLTKQRGCDIVINCTQGEIKNTTLKCCASSGITIDVAQLPNNETYDFGMYNLTTERSYIIVDFSSILQYENYNDITMLQTFVSEGIARGYVRPLTRITYNQHEPVRAFRLLSSSQHRGRVLLRLLDNEEGLDTPLITNQLSTLKAPNSNQLIICDIQDFGIKLVHNLIKHGAKILHLHCRDPSSYLEYKKQSWITLGAQVDVSFQKLNSKEAVESMLKECNLVGEVEAIHIISTGVVDKVSRYEMKAMLSSVDLVSRRICSKLRYFTVISDSEIGYDVVVNRYQSGLPSLLVHFQQVNDLKTPTKKKQTLPVFTESLDTIQKALFSKDLIVKVFACPTPQQRIMEEISKCTGIPINNSMLDRLTLDQAGVDIKRANELCVTLEKTFNIPVSVETLLCMKIGQLKDLDNRRFSVYKDSDGFGALYTLIDNDELTSTSEIVMMHTLPHSTDRRPDELERGLSYLCIVPGLEGHYRRFETLCERLKVPAIVLPPGTDKPKDSIPDIARRLVNIIMKKLKPKEYYYLLGYEFGAMIILEMARILEELGFVGTIYLLGGTPDDIRDSIKMQLASLGDKWEDALALHMYYLLTGTTSSHLEQQLEKTETWEQKKTIWLKELRQKVTLSTQYMLNQIDTAHSRIKLLFQYKTKTTTALRSKIVILKANMPNLLRTENFERLSEQEVSINNLDATLTYATEDLRCSTIINKYLEPDVIEVFDNNNQCETALLSGNMYQYIGIDS